jgi:hypothetical protein
MRDKLASPLTFFRMRPVGSNPAVRVVNFRC